MFEVKDAYTAGHSRRVALYSLKIAQEMGLSETDQNTIYQAGLLHDVGKILTPESILLKPQKFKRKEYFIMQNHSTDGEKMINSIPSFKEYSRIVRHHHERYDGRGYPDGLAGENIPLLSRIMTIADAFDAMTTNRIYRARKNLAEAVLELDRCSGTQFDPHIVKHAVSVFCAQIQWDESPDRYNSEDRIQEERFAFHFKDTLTGVYTGEYLNHFLRSQHERTKIGGCILVQVHNMHHYNGQYGWKSGDKALVEIALRLKILFVSKNIFRLFGDDFVVLNPIYLGLGEEELLAKLEKGFNGVKISLKHLNCETLGLKKWEQFEHHLTKRTAEKQI